MTGAKLFWRRLARPPLNELIEDPDWRKAFEKPDSGNHSIYELVHHIAVWAVLGREGCL